MTHLTKPSRVGAKTGVAALAALLLLATWAWPATAAPGADFDSLVRQGRLALDTARPQAASDLFEQAAALAPERISEIAPDRSWAFMRLGNDAIVRLDRQRADHFYTLASQVYPKFVTCFAQQWVFARIFAINDAVESAGRSPRRANWARVERMIDWGLRIEPGNLQLHYLRGVLDALRGRDADARSEFLTVLGGVAPEDADALKALSDAAAKRATKIEYSFDMRPVYPPWQDYDTGPWQILKDGPFVIYHHNRALADRVAAALKYYLTQPVLSGILARGDPFPDECKVYIAPNREAFRHTGPIEEWAAGSSKFTLLDGKLQSASIHLFQTDADLMESAVPHELTHVRLVASAHFYEGLGVWLQEGVATSSQSEYAKTMMARKLVQAYESNSLIAVANILTSKTYPEGEASDLYYGESLAIVESLVRRYGKSAFWHFVSTLKGDDQVSALERAYSLTPAQLEDLVLEWIDVHRGGHRSTVGRREVRSPKQALATKDTH